MKYFLINLLRKLTQLTRNGGAAGGNTLARNAHEKLEHYEQKQKNKEK
ncbi:hypothetical protein EsVE80_03900 [Enterococcus saigonensis]|uniref:Uncharacterized protein n=1 Tax=Enterococcus saigonensis TaxID=1805431 RepID=A0A679IPE7_9ENTE|nr:hypothetical protein [Enterococcus saigonensis]BCA84867.1 hypothetical protein EsVE80_03900 [Enterococcus saigonensis]